MVTSPKTAHGSHDRGPFTRSTRAEVSPLRLSDLACRVPCYMHPCGGPSRNRYEMSSGRHRVHGGTVSGDYECSGRLRLLRPHQLLIAVREGTGYESDAFLGQTLGVAPPRSISVTRTSR